MTEIRRCAVLGSPIAHSLSPVLHGAAYRALGLDWVYDAHEVGEGGLASFLAGLDEEWRGLSLTMPLKREALGLADEVSDTGRLAGAVNTLVRDGDRWLADNTDVPGAVAALREAGVEVTSSAVLLGGGATATSMGLALIDLGCSDLRLLVRSPERAEETRAVLAGHPAAPRVEVGSLDDAAPGAARDVVVSTIPATAQHDALIDALVGASSDAPAVFDVIYHPWPTPLAARALADGRALVSGLDLLAHQAVLQVELFTGRRVDVSVLREAGEKALGR